MVTVRRYTGESILLHKARWEEDGGLGEGGTFGLRTKVPPSPKKLAYIWKKRRGGTPGIMRASASLR